MMLVRSSEDLSYFYCISCTGLLSKNDVYVILYGNVYHEHCFKCSMCRTSVLKKFFIRQKKILCEIHFQMHYDGYCGTCDNEIRGPVTCFKNVLYHSECFHCIRCHKYLNLFASFIMVNTSYLYCFDCIKIVYPYYGSVSNILSIFSMEHVHFTIHYNLRLFFGTAQPKFFISIELYKGNSSEESLGNKLTVFRAIKKKNFKKSNDAIVLRCLPGNCISREVPFLLSNDRITSFNFQNVCKSNIKKLKKYLNASIMNIKSLIVERLAKERNYSLNLKNGRNMQIHSNPFLEYPVGDSYAKKFKERCQSWNYLNRLPITDISKPYNQNKTNKMPLLSKTYSQDDLSLISNQLDRNIFRCQSQGFEKVTNPVFTKKDLDIMEKLGEGFFGVVYKVINKTTKEVYVLKRLKNVDPNERCKFRDEVKLMKSLDHPNITKFMGVLMDKDGIDLIIEYIPFGTLRSLIESIQESRRANFTNKDCFYIAKCITSGMSYLHSKKIAHRDLTSHNCLVRNTSLLSVAISDFGLCRIMNDDNTTKQDIAGSAYWMAPEMLHGKAYSLAIDVYSFGIILCEILSLANPDPENLTRLNNFGLDINAFLKRVPKYVNTFLINTAARCCSFEPENRPDFITLSALIVREYEELFGKSLYRKLSDVYRVTELN